MAPENKSRKICQRPIFDSENAELILRLTPIDLKIYSTRSRIGSASNG